jgi:hypothetical protein
MPKKPAYFDSQASAAATLKIDVSELREAKAEGCPAFRSGRVYTAPLLAWFACPSCAQHISATRSQIGMWAPCPNCNAAVIVPTTSTLPPPRPVPLPVPLQTKFQEKKRYKTTVILIDDYAAEPAKTKKLEKWTDDFTDARNWLIRELGAFRGGQYSAEIFDHMQERSVFKEKRRGRSDLL